MLDALVMVDVVAWCGVLAEGEGRDLEREKAGRYIDCFEASLGSGKCSYIRVKHITTSLQQLQHITSE